VDWCPTSVVHEGPIWENGYLAIQDKPEYGVEINPDVARISLPAKLGGDEPSLLLCRVCLHQ
jgi:L-alanine-DL-glutamate epimerase-like enolase superfamily enzyme